MTQNSNQFAQSTEKGLLSPTNGSVDAGFSCQVVTGESTALVHAQAVKFSDTASKTITITAATANTDKIFGFLAYDVKKTSYKAQELVKVFTDGACMTMEAGAAIARGAAVQIVPTGQKVITKASGTTIGTVLDKATADGDLVRVLITTNGQ